MRRIVNKGVPLFLIVALFLATLITQRTAAGIFDKVIDSDDRYYLPPSGWLRLFSLGYNEAMADLVWVKTIIYFGDQMKQRQRGKADGFVMNYLLTAVDLDPRFRALYTIGSTLTMYQSSGKVTRKSLDMAIALLERGIKAFPDDGELYFNLGFIHHYEMLNFISDDPNDPITKEHLRLGRYYFSRAALMDNAPPYAALLSATLMQKWGMADMVVEHLKAMLLKETDPNIRAQLIEKLRAEAGKAAERDILETGRLQQAWRDEMPYVPYDFYLILRTDTPVAERLNPLYLTDQMLTFKEGEAAKTAESESDAENDADAGVPDGGR